MSNMPFGPVQVYPCASSFCMRQAAATLPAMRTLHLRLALRFSLWLLLCSLPAAYAHAAPDMALKVALEGEILTCSASLLNPPEGVRQALSEGSEVSAEWKISVEIERKYWLNNTVASVVVNRHVVPDLVSQSWKLEDRSSGISRRVFSLDEAIRFLTELPDFPIVDRSLLTSGQAYVVVVTARKREGDRKDDWWTRRFGAKNGITAEFLMP